MFTVDAGKYKLIFCLPRQPAVFVMYREIYVHVFAIIKHPHSILASVLLKKIKQYCLKFHAAGEQLCFNQLRCLLAMCSAISVGPRGMFQPIAVAMT